MTTEQEATRAYHLAWGARDFAAALAIANRRISELATPSQVETDSPDSLAEQAHIGALWAARLSLAQTAVAGVSARERQDSSRLAPANLETPGLQDRAAWVYDVAVVSGDIARARAIARDWLRCAEQASSRQGADTRWRWAGRLALLEALAPKEQEA